MINNYDTHVSLMKRNLKDLGLCEKQIDDDTKMAIYTDLHPLATVGKMFEDDWED